MYLNICCFSSKYVCVCSAFIICQYPFVLNFFISSDAFAFLSVVAAAASQYVLLQIASKINLLRNMQSVFVDIIGILNVPVCHFLLQIVSVMHECVSIV